MTGLRERKKEQTRRLIAETARHLFSERGFERVTIAEIAEAADVAVQTVFNYFPTKEDLVYWRLSSFEDELLAAVRDRPPGASALEAFQTFLLAQGGLLGRHQQARDELLSFTRMIAESPALQARERQIFAGYTDTLSALLAEETGARGDDIRPRVAAGAMIGVHRALIDYTRGRMLAGDLGPRLTRDVKTQAQRAFRLLEGELGDYARVTAKCAATRRSTSGLVSRSPCPASGTTSSACAVRRGNARTDASLSAGGSIVSAAARDHQRRRADQRGAGPVGAAGHRHERAHARVLRRDFGRGAPAERVAEHPERACAARHRRRWSSRKSTSSTRSGACSRRAVPRSAWRRATTTKPRLASRAHSRCSTPPASRSARARRRSAGSGSRAGPGPRRPGRAVVARPAWRRRARAASERGEPRSSRAAVRRRRGVRAAPLPQLASNTSVTIQGRMT